MKDVTNSQSVIFSMLGCDSSSFLELRNMGATSHQLGAKIIKVDHVKKLYEEYSSMMSTGNAVAGVNAGNGTLSSQKKFTFRPDKETRAILIEKKNYCDEELAVVLPSKNGLKLLVQTNTDNPYESYEKIKSINFSLHKNFKTIELAKESHHFLLFDSGVFDDNKRIMIFGTQQNLTRLQMQRHWFSDGTFDPINGYFYHFKQNIWRHIQNEGLCTLYNEKESDFRISAKMLFALAFVPTKDVVAVFVQLNSNIPHNLEPVYKYLEKYYIGSKKPGKVGHRHKPLYPIEMWNVYDRRSYATNQQQHRRMALYIPNMC
ncbi:unnamed protein product [Brachionus calyciflorus]|uniref:Uncharacterized protein n=1 Tax=Brachionus calyciflorus TaxID=104777 RepID=A0A814ED98_9BILA|nr:unnamed protein product [Brachionus calyciflorus]